LIDPPANPKVATVAVSAVGGGVGHVIVAGLRSAPWPVRIVGFEVRAAAPSAFACDVLHRVPPAGDSAYRRRILELCVSERVDLLIPGSDPELPVLASLAAELEAGGCAVAVSDPRAIAVCADKAALADHLAASQVPFALTRTVPRFEEDPPGWDYPLILKPRFGSGSVGVEVVTGAADWRRLRDRVSRDRPDRWIVQPLLRSVSWSDELWERVARDGQLVQQAQMACQYLTSAAGTLLGRYAAEINLRAGVAMASTAVDDPAVWSVADRAVASLARLGLRGPLNLQGLVTEGGLVLFEVNPRFTGTTHVRALTGFREVEATVRHFVFGDGREALEPLLRLNTSETGVREMTERIVPTAWVERFESTGRLAPPLPLGRAVITGASGFLGRTLVPALLEAGVVNEVVAPTRRPQALSAAWPGSNVAPCSWDDLRDAAVAPVDLVIHAAAVRPPTASSPAALFAEDTGLTRSVAEFVRSRQVPFFVYVSSQSVYAGSQPPPWHEGSPQSPATPYGYAKAAGEAIAASLAGGATRTAIVRLARLWGLAEEMREDEIVPRFVARAASGGALRVDGDGTQLLDLLHVRDAASFFIALLRGDDRAWCRSFNVGGGAPLSIAELAAACLDLAGGGGPAGAGIAFVPRVERPPSYGLDASAARSILGWTPRMSLRVGLAEIAARLGSPAQLV